MTQIIALGEHRCERRVVVIDFTVVLRQTPGLQFKFEIKSDLSSNALHESPVLEKERNW